MSGLGSALRRMDLTVARQAQMKDWIVVWNFIKKKKKTQADLFHIKEFHREEKRPPNKKGRA